jgi:hypothetical protein
MSIPVTPELEAGLAAKKAAWVASRAAQGLPEWVCLRCRARARAATRPEACPKCQAVTHEDELRPKPPGACSAAGCRAPATARPSVWVWRTALRDGEPAKLNFAAEAAGAACVARLTLADFATPAFQAQLDQAWARDKKDPICWVSAELHWAPLDAREAAGGPQ